MDHLQPSNTTPPVTSATPNAPITNLTSFPDLNRVRTPKAIKRETRQIQKHEHEMQEEFIFTEQTFLNVLCNYRAFDILTYSVMPFKLFNTCPIRRLVYGVGTPPRGCAKALQLTHTHAKLWICYRNDTDKSPDVYVGSANATDMTILDLTIKVNSRQAKTLIEYFNLLWDINYKNK